MEQAASVANTGSRDRARELTSERAGKIDREIKPR